VAVTSGYNIEHLFGQYCGTGLILSHAPGNSRLAYYYLMLNKMFGGICQITGSPTCPLLLCGDAPQSGPVPVDFMKIGDSIMRTGPATVRLGIAHTGRVQVNIYDVAGRKVRKLADRVFPEGQAALPWDGTDNTGHKLPRGVYFVRSTTDPTPGRIIVLNP
jgi:hypothetical protein